MNTAPLQPNSDEGRNPDRVAFENLVDEAFRIYFKRKDEEMKAPFRIRSPQAA